jgi:hypothetical protein
LVFTDKHLTGFFIKKPLCQLLFQFEAIIVISVPSHSALLVFCIQGRILYHS